jgi:archaellum component FlaC
VLVSEWKCVAEILPAAAKLLEAEQGRQAAVTESERKFAQLKREGQAAQAEFIEVMEQAEAEFDDNTDRLKQELQATKQAAKEMEEDLNAQTHVYTRYGLACWKWHPAGTILCCSGA